MAGVPAIAREANTAVAVLPNVNDQPFFCRRSGRQKPVPLSIKCETEFNTPCPPLSRSSAGLAHSYRTWRLIDAPAWLPVYLAWRPGAVDPSSVLVVMATKTDERS